MTAPVIDVWFDFASTYSYPAAMRAGRLAADAGIAWRYRPFLLGPIFQAQGWETSPFNIYASKGRYMWRDLERLCDELSIPFQHPKPFPQNSLLAARVALAAAQEPWLGDYCRAVFRAQFGEGLRIDDPAVIGGILRQLDISAGPFLERAQSDQIKLLLRQQTVKAAELGIFGAPSFVTADGELFWGNDRLEAAIAWALRGSGT